MKIAFLWPRLSGYMNSCLKALASRPGIELFVSNLAAGREDPFDSAQFAWIKDRYQFEKEPDVEQLMERVEAFKPDIILGGVWNYAGYRYVCRQLRGRCIRICLIDNQWRGTAKQWLGAFAAPWYLHRLYDGIFAPGERQFYWARQMGFAETQIWRGSLSCDVSEFQQVHDAGRTADNRKFLFVGRLVPEKGITALAAGYKEYRKASREPWPLYASGTGPLQHCLEGIPGVTCTGFLQSAQLAEVFRDSSCLVLPSSFEPWGIVIHEAATAGLSVICSSECGASVHLVQDGYNGFIIPSGDANSVAAALMRFSSLPAERRREMANASAALALQFSPERWASTVLEHASRIQAREYFRG